MRSVDTDEGAASFHSATRTTETTTTTTTTTTAENEGTAGDFGRPSHHHSFKRETGGGGGEGGSTNTLSCSSYSNASSSSSGSGGSILRRYPFQMEYQPAQCQEEEEEEEEEEENQDRNNFNALRGLEQQQQQQQQQQQLHDDNDEERQHHHEQQAGGIMMEQLPPLLLVRRHRWSNKAICLVLIAAIMLLGIFLAVFQGSLGPGPIAVASDKKHKKNNNNIANSNFPSSSSCECPSGSNNNDAASSSTSLLGTCRDPIYDLQSQASIHGVEHGAVASDHPKCSQMGVSILRDLGGNAIDAAVTTALCLGVASPASSGVGGGAFILIHADPVQEQQDWKHTPFYDARDDALYTAAINEPIPLLRTATGKITEVVDCREVAPQLASRDMFLNTTLSPYASTMGGLAVAVPGELKGLELAHARHGRLSWADVVKPVVELAREGVPINLQLADRLIVFRNRILQQQQQTEQQQQSAGTTNNNNAANTDFLHPLRKFLTKDDDWDHPLQAGDVLKNPALANLLERVMNEGTKQVFTSSGTVAQDLAHDIQMAGGTITAEELDAYQPTLRTPLMADDVFGHALVSVPPCSSGGAAVIGIARFLAAMSIPLATHADTLSQHWFVEACRHVYAIRMSLSDPAFNTETVTSAVHDLIHGNYMRQLFLSSNAESVLPFLSDYGGTKWAQLLKTATTTTTNSNNNNNLHGPNSDDMDNGGKERNRRHGRRDSEPGDDDDQQNHHRRMYRRFGYLEDHGTSHFSIIDKDGNAVAMTSTINTLFGSSVMSEKTGIILNSQMDDFATPGRSNSYGLAPAESNFIAPGKKPLSSMSPTLVFRVDADPNASSNSADPSMKPPARILGPLVLALGGSGGSRIITAVAQVLLNFVVLGKPLFDAIVHARIHDQLITGEKALAAVERRSLVTGEHISVSQITREALLRRKHELYESNFTGVVQGISVDLETGTLDAVSDIRKGGRPDGY